MRFRFRLKFPPAAMLTALCLSLLATIATTTQALGNPERAAKTNRVAVVISADAGYSTLVIGAEMRNVATWLNEHRISGGALEHDLPQGRSQIPLADVLCSLRTAWANAKAWKIELQRINFVGLSSGSQVESTTGRHFDAGDREAADQDKRVTSCPDFFVTGTAARMESLVARLPKVARRANEYTDPGSRD